MHKIINSLDREQLYQKWRPTIERTHIWSWTSHSELSLLCEFASLATSIIEVGSYHGKSAACMALANPNAGVTCIDQPQDQHCANILRENADHFGFRVFLGTSGDFKFDGKYDFAFIDAGHTESDVTADINNLLPHMTPGAIMAGHDFRRDNPMDGVNVAVYKAFEKSRVNVLESIWWVQL